MHFSALTVLACALVAVTARPVDNGATGVAPALVNVAAPVAISNVGNDNKLAALNWIGNSQRDLVNAWVPISITDILNCNNVEIANDLLNRLSLHLGCTIEALGVTVADLLDHGNGQAVWSKLNALKPTQAKRDLVGAYVPITLTDILNCNNVEIANHILNGLAAHLGITVKAIGVTVEDLLNHGNGQAVWSKLNALKPAQGKRDLVKAWAPITLTDILNCNTIKIANDILNGLAVHLGITVKEIGVTVEDLLHHGNGQDVWSKLNALKPAQGKRDAVDVKAPITLQNILNCNTVDVANDLLNAIAVYLGITVEAIGVTVHDLLDHGNGQAIWSKFNALKAAHGKRDAVAAYVPIKISDVLNCNTIKIANDLLNHLALVLKVTVAELDVTAEHLVGLKGDKAQSVFNALQAVIAKILGEHKRDVANVGAPVSVTNVANYNMVDVLNNVANSKGGKRDGAANVVAPVDVNNVANYNMVDVLNNVANSKGGKRDGSLVNLDSGLSVTHVLDDNTVNVANDIANSGKWN